MECGVYHYHRPQEFFFAHGTAKDARSYLARINYQRTSNLWSMRRIDADRPRGIDLAAAVRMESTQCIPIMASAARAYQHATHHDAAIVHRLAGHGQPVIGE